MQPLTSEATPETIQAVREVYRQAFGTTAQQAADFVDGQLLRHVGYSGFSGVMAVDDGDLVGFAYGYRSCPGRWWHDQVSSTIIEAGFADWLEDAFEFVEIAVVPPVQGKGVGGRLHDELIDGASERTALLSTAMANTTAQRFYRARGWRSLVEGFRYGGQGEPVNLMGLMLANASIDPYR